MPQIQTCSAVSRVIVSQLPSSLPSLTRISSYFSQSSCRTGCRRETNSGSEPLPLNTGTTTEMFMRCALSSEQAVKGTSLTVEIEPSLKDLDQEENKNPALLHLLSKRSGMQDATNFQSKTGSKRTELDR